MANPLGSPSSRSSVGRMSRWSGDRTSGRLTRILGRSQTLQATGRFLRRQLWAWPIIAAAILGIAGWWVNRAVVDSMRQQRISELTTILQSDVAALRAWMIDQQSTTELAARDERLLPFTQELLELADGKPDVVRRLVQSPALAAIRV